MRKYQFLILALVITTLLFSEESFKNENITLKEFTERVDLSLVVPTIIKNYFSKDQLVHSLYDGYKSNTKVFFNDKLDVLITIKNKEFYIICTVTGFKPAAFQVLLGIAPNFYPNILNLNSVQSLLSLINLWYLSSVKSIQSIDASLFNDASGMPVHYLLHLIKSDYSSFSLHAVLDEQKPMNVKLLHPVNVVINGIDPVIAIPFKGNAYALERWRYIIDPPTSKITGDRNDSAFAYDFFEVYY